MFRRIISHIQRFRENYGEWAREATYRRGMALAGPNALTYQRYRAIYDRLADRWQVGSGLWNPPLDQGVPPHAIVVQEQAFRQEVGIAAVQLILRERRITRVFELDEIGLGFAFGVERVLNPDDIADCYWTSESADWLIYRSREGCLAFAGAWLVQQIQRMWPGWNQHLWR